MSAWPALLYQWTCFPCHGDKGKFKVNGKDGISFSEHAFCCVWGR